MAKKTKYTVTRVPANDWDNLMETVSLDGSYSEEIKDEIESALENMEDFSEPWVVVTLKEGKAAAKIFPNEQFARKFVGNSNGKLSGQQVFCVKGQYQKAK
jgi:hypothetical protein